jgi:hypothetical protein
MLLYVCAVTIADNGINANLTAYSAVHESENISYRLNFKEIMILTSFLVSEGSEALLDYWNIVPYIDFTRKSISPRSLPRNRSEPYDISCFYVNLASKMSAELTFCTQVRMGNSTRKTMFKTYWSQRIKMQLKTLFFFFQWPSI